MFLDSSFYEKGYQIIPAENPEKLVDLRFKIFAKAKELLKTDEQDPSRLFNQFHSHNVSGTSLNEVRMTIIRHCTATLNVGQALFDAFPRTITDLVGSDVVVQKTTNLVIQQPNDPDVVTTHRDAPPNSKFEVVLWLPLVDVYETKSMYVLDKKGSKDALDLLRKTNGNHEEFVRFGEKNGENLKIPFGHGCFFWPGLVHGSHRNQEKETRWSLNMRYKNLFSPCGSKGLPEFFDLLKLSPLSRLALELEKEEHDR